MKVIIFEEEAYHKMLQEIKQIIQEATSPKKEEWINEKEAMQLLGIRGKTKLQQLRDNLKDFVKF